MNQPDHTESFDFQPQFEGKHVLLRPLLSTDYEALYEVASDPLIWMQHPEPERYQKDVFDAFFEKAHKSQSAFVVLDKRTKKVIGSTRYYDYQPNERTVVIGYTFLSRAYWGKPHNAEMKKLMIEYAFQYVDRIFFHIWENNMRSRKAIEKIGATPCGTMQAKTHRGDTVSVVIYEVKKP